MIYTLPNLENNEWWNNCPQVFEPGDFLLTTVGIRFVIISKTDVQTKIGKRCRICYIKFYTRENPIQKAIDIPYGVNQISVFMYMNGLTKVTLVRDTA